MTINEIYAKIEQVTTKYGFQRELAGDRVNLRDKKGRLAGSINEHGTVDRKYVGQKVLLGALVRNELVEALK